MNDVFPRFLLAGIDSLTDIRERAMTSIASVVSRIFKPAPARPESADEGLPTAAMVFFGEGVSDEDLADSQIRARTLKDGLRAIEENVADIEILKVDSFLCSATVAGTNRAIDHLERFVKESVGGTVARDVHTRPAVRAALSHR